ncbi:C6 transcription factor, putative [Talaromyces islandicus]|uniref:C6 transcription factor, putative n=1 Tax=Talaromyces islandicus TaxID=28573 RepID=A0A0U1M756_TALIS|nr:C6 transcription factor, putative [Talaromyces islandicus]
MEGGDLSDLSRQNVEFSDKTRFSNAVREGVVHQIGVETPRQQQGGQLDTNWLSILDDIKEVREELSQSDIYSPEDNNDANDAPDVDLVFGPVGVADFQDILNSVPSRPICDKFLSEYFNAPFMLPIIHTIKFQNEYEKFWQDPNKAPVLWVGLLFSILALAALVRDAINPQRVASDQDTISAKNFHIRTAQCLVLGNYTNSRAYSLETLMLHLIGKYVVKSDSSLDGWFLMGIIIRLAMRLSFHRDPKTRMNISPFDGEMQRRMGMPSMIPSQCCDTEPPGNFNDSDIHPELESLPSPRPVTDNTPVLYTIVKGKIMGVFREVIAHAQSPTSFSSYPVTLELDSKLRKAYAEIPQFYKIEPISRSFLVPSGVIMCRCTLELLFQKATIVLHRRYLNVEALDPQWEYSRRTCITAAQDTLSLQEDLHHAASPGGRLYEDRWLLSSLTSHDFLLASMVICLELSVLMRSSNAPSSQITGRLNTLLRSQRVWMSRSEHSKEARTATLALQLMIEKAQGNLQSRAYDKAINEIKVDPLQNATGPVSIGDGFLDTEIAELPLPDSMTDIINGSESLDWTQFDQYFLNGGLPTQLDIVDGTWDLLDMGPD